MSQTPTIDAPAAGPSNKAKIGVGIFVAINLVIVAVLLLGGGKDDETSSTDSTTSVSSPGSGSVGDGSSTTVGGNTVVTVAAPPFLTTSATPDTFDRTGEGMGSSGTYTWVGLSGTWKTEDGQAMCTGHEGYAAYAVFSTGEQRAGQFEVTMPVLRDGQGIVFRFVDEKNYWSLRAVPDFGTWHLAKVVDGVETKVADVFGPVTDGTAPAVQLQGDVIAIYFDGLPNLAISDPTNAGANQVGITMKGPQTTEARFDDAIWTPA